jgi:type II secretory pathway pseudopilin PulG
MGMHRHASSRLGFVLIEMVLVIGITALAAMAAISGVRWARNIGLKSAANRVVSQMRLAQRRAVTEVCQYRVQVVPAGTKVYVTRIVTDQYGTITEQPQGRLTASLPGGARIESTTFPHNQVIFDATGAPNSAGDIVVSLHGVETEVVEVAPGTGFARVKTSTLE